MLKILKSILGFVGKMFLLIIVLVILLVFASKIRNNIIFDKVSKIVKQETELINLPNEITEEREISLNEYNLGCSYDYKVGATRCNSRYSNYYTSENHPCYELNNINKYLIGLGWESSSPSKDYSVEKCKRMYDMKFMPFGIYYKKNKYNLELHVTFYVEKDRSDGSFEHEKKINSLLDRYLNKYPSLYRISVSADII